MEPVRPRIRPSYAPPPRTTVDIANEAVRIEAGRGELLVAWMRALLITCAMGVLFVQHTLPAVLGESPGPRRWLPLMLAPSGVFAWIWLRVVQTRRYQPVMGRISIVTDVLFIAFFMAAELELRPASNAPGLLLASLPPIQAVFFMAVAAGVRQDARGAVLGGLLSVLAMIAILWRAVRLSGLSAIATNVREFALVGPWFGRGLIFVFAVALVALAARNSRRMARDAGDAVSEQNKVMSLFGRYVDPEIARSLMGTQARAAAETREVTVLFTDLRDFTAMTERLEATEVLDILNGYYARLIPIVHRHGGIVNKFIGDAIMATFGAPLQLDNHAACGVKVALEMLEATKVLNVENERLGRPELRMGVGIATGTVVVGRLGGDERLEYAVIGDTVNTASRLEGLNKELKTRILMTAATRDALGPDVATRSLGEVPVKGKARAVEVFTVVDT